MWSRAATRWRGFLLWPVLTLMIGNHSVLVYQKQALNYCKTRHRISLLPPHIPTPTLPRPVFGATRARWATIMEITGTEESSRFRTLSVIKQTKTTSINSFRRRVTESIWSPRALCEATTFKIHWESFRHCLLITLPRSQKSSSRDILVNRWGRRTWTRIA